MRHRISLNWPFAAMTTLWTLVLLTFAILLDCGTVRASAVKHQLCAMEIQKLCRELNEKLAETTGTFSSNYGNNTVMCGYLLQTLKCVARHAPHDCSDWFLDVNSFYFQSPFDCKMTIEIAQEIQDIKKENQNTGGNSRSENQGNNGGSVTTGDETRESEVVTSSNGSDMLSETSRGEVATASNGGDVSPGVNDAVTKGDNSSSNSVVESGKKADVDKNGGYTVANVHGDKAQQAGNGSSTWSTFGMSLLISATLMPRLMTKYLVL